MTAVGIESARPVSTNGGATPPTDGEAATRPVARKRTPYGGYGRDVVDRVRCLVVETETPIPDIAAEVGTAASTVRNWIRRYDWPRPPGAPPLTGARKAFDPETRRAGLTVRLYRAVGRQLKRLEASDRAENDALAEKDARTLGVLAKTLGTLKALERDDGAGTQGPGPVDRDELNADLARRITRWAEGREGR